MASYEESRKEKQKAVKFSFMDDSTVHKEEACTSKYFLLHFNVQSLFLDLQPKKSIVFPEKKI